jgi:hypothetical protein
MPTAVEVSVPILKKWCLVKLAPAAIGMFEFALHFVSQGEFFATSPSMMPNQFVLNRFAALSIVRRIIRIATEEIPLSAWAEATLGAAASLHGIFG